MLTHHVRLLLETIIKRDSKFNVIPPTAHSSGLGQRRISADHAFNAAQIDIMKVGPRITWLPYYKADHNRTWVGLESNLSDIPKYKLPVSDLGAIDSGTLPGRCNPYSRAAVDALRLPAPLSN